MVSLILLAATLSRAFLTPDHLVPEESPLTQFVRTERELSCNDFVRTLSPAFDRSVRIFVVQDCSPFPESVVGLKLIDDQYYIFGTQPSGPTSVRPTSRPPPPLKLLGTDGKYHTEPIPAESSKGQPTYSYKTCRADIDQKLAERLVRVWDSVLLETRPVSGRISPVLDGAISHFGSNMQSGLVTGVAMGTPRESRPGWLGLASYDLSAMCWNWKMPGAEPPLTELDGAVTHLEGR